jgi:hypothetical protein
VRSGRSAPVKRGELAGMAFARFPTAMDNERDKHGAATCPVCREGFRTSATVVRVGRYMVHLPCAQEARRQVECGTLASPPAGPFKL